MDWSLHNGQNKKIMPHRQTVIRLNSQNHVRKHAHCMLPCFVLLCLLLSSCRNDMKKAIFFDPVDLPQQSLDSVRVVRSNDGNKQMTITAQQVIITDKPEKVTRFPNGFHMMVFNANGKSVADIKADRALSRGEQRIIEAAGNIVIVDFRSGDTTYFDTLVWNSFEHVVKSDKPVRSVNGLRVTVGDGFYSDDDFVSPIIVHQRGTMTIDE